MVTVTGGSGEVRSGVDPFLSDRGASNLPTTEMVDFPTGTLRCRDTFHSGRVGQQSWGLGPTPPLPRCLGLPSSGLLPDPLFRPSTSRRTRLLDLVLRRSLTDAAPKV